MKAGADQSDATQGLRLVRAFLSLPPEKRAEVIAFVEALARAQGAEESPAKGGKEASPT